MTDPLNFIRQWLALPRITLGLLLAIGLVAGLFAINEYGYNRSAQALRMMNDGVKSRLALNRVLRLILDAETGHRGYLLTSDEKYLQPYESALAEIGGAMNDLRDSYAAPDPQHLKTLNLITTSVQRKLAEMALILKVRESTRNDEAWKFILNSDEGKRYMDQVRTGSDVILNDISGQIALNQQQVQRSLMISRVAIALAALAALLAFYFYLRESEKIERMGAQQHLLLRAERDQLQQQVRRRTARLTELASYLQTTTEREREHLARELHDELGALLTAAKFDVARLKSKMTGATTETRQRLEHLTETLNGVIALKRRIIEDLRPSALSNLGLIASLEILAREYGQRLGLNVETLFEETPIADASLQLTIYRMIQEALTNIGKYAQASHVRVRLARYEHHAEIEVRDDGCGFDISDTKIGSHGLDGMRHRVEAAGGRLDIDSKPGQGTTLLAIVPYGNAPAG